MKMTCENQWEGCYNDNWMGDIVPEAFSHPAKYSRSLIHRIYQHAKEMGWVKAGDVVLDCFGGVTLGGLDAMGMGLNWIGVELEPKFVALGEQNIELWNRQLRGWHNLGTARIIQGDSRKIKDVIEKADLVVSSPPFLNLQGTGSGKLEARKGRTDILGKYGDESPGNLANMKEGDIDCVISSPPYEEMPIEQTHMTSNKRGDPNNPNYRPSWKKKLSEGYADTKRPYGKTDGQLGSMKESSVDAVISSPPYENSLMGDVEDKISSGFKSKKAIAILESSPKGYSKLENNLGNQSGDTFWQASKEIVQGCFDLLKPSGMAIWVLKDYIKAGKRVPFSQNWASLCESIGFEIVCWHRAMLVKEHGVQITLDNEEESITTERKSFFRRLAEKRGSPCIDWEDIICMKKGG